MRMLILAATLALPASSLAQPAPKDRMPSPPRAITVPPGSKVNCIANRVQHADGFDTSRPRRLDEMPPGKLYLSVMREVDGCQELVLVSEERNRATLRR